MVNLACLHKKKLPISENCSTFKIIADLIFLFQLKFFNFLHSRPFSFRNFCRVVLYVSLIDNYNICTKYKWAIVHSSRLFREYSRGVHAAVSVSLICKFLKTGAVVAIFEI